MKQQRYLVVFFFVFFSFLLVKLLLYFKNPKKQRSNLYMQVYIMNVVFCWYSLWILVKEDQEEELQRNTGRRWWITSHCLNQLKNFSTIPLGQDERGSSRISTPNLSSSSTTILMYNYVCIGLYMHVYVCIN